MHKAAAIPPKDCGRFCHLIFPRTHILSIPHYHGKAVSHPQNPNRIFNIIYIRRAETPPHKHITLQPRPAVGLLVTPKTNRPMSFIIMILCFFAWLGEALNDGSNIK